MTLFQIGWQSTFTKDYVSEGRYVFHVVRNDVSNYGMGILSDFAGIYLASHPGCSGPKAVSSLPTVIAKCATGLKTFFTNLFGKFSSLEFVKLSSSCKSCFQYDPQRLSLSLRRDGNIWRHCRFVTHR